MLSHLPNEYWTKFKDYIVAIGVCDDGKKVCTIEDLYAELAEKENESNQKFGVNIEVSAKSLFLDYIERPMIKILDESYILKYMTMRAVTYFYYDYYENPRRVDPVVVIFDEDANVKEQIPPQMWKWWVDEMGY